MLRGTPIICNGTLAIYIGAHQDHGSYYDVFIPGQIETKPVQCSECCTIDGAKIENNLLAINWEAMLSNETLIFGGKFYRLKNLEARIRLPNLLDIPPTSWPKTLQELVQTRQPKKCRLPLDSDNSVVCGDTAIQWQKVAENELDHFVHVAIHRKSPGGRSTFSFRTHCLRFSPEKSIQEWVENTKREIDFALGNYKLFTNSYGKSSEDDNT